MTKLFLLALSLKYLLKTILVSLIDLLNNYPVTELYLTGNSFPVNKDDYIHLAKLLHSSNSLNVLGIDIDNIDLSDAPIHFTSNRISSLCDIRMTECRLSPKIDKIGEMLSWCKPIVSVYLSFNALGDEGVKRLVKYIQNTAIHHFNVSGNNITTVDIDH